MIEITWIDASTCEHETMMFMSNFIAWLCTTIAQDEKNRRIEYQGYMLVKEPSGKCSALILCGDMKSQTKILGLLQQPPEQFRGRYIACVPCEEPTPVKEESESDDKGEIKMEIT